MKVGMGRCLGGGRRGKAWRWPGCGQGGDQRDTNRWVGDGQEMLLASHPPPQPPPPSPFSPNLPILPSPSSRPPPQVGQVTEGYEVALAELRAQLATAEERGAGLAAQLAQRSARLVKAEGSLERVEAMLAEVRAGGWDVGHTTRYPRPRPLDDGGWSCWRKEGRVGSRARVAGAQPMPYTAAWGVGDVCWRACRLCLGPSATPPPAATPTFTPSTCLLSRTLRTYRRSLPPSLSPSLASARQTRSELTALTAASRAAAAEADALQRSLRVQLADAAEGSKQHQAAKAELEREVGWSAGGLRPPHSRASPARLSLHLPPPSLPPLPRSSRPWASRPSCWRAHWRCR